MADLDAGGGLEFVGEDLSGAEPTLIILGIEDEDAIAQVEVETFSAFGVGIILDDPESALSIPGHGDGVLHVGFGSGDAYVEAWRRSKGSGGFDGVEGGGIGVWFGVVGDGEIGLEDGCAEHTHQHEEAQDGVHGSRV